MPYTELAKDERGNRVPMAIQTSLNPPTSYEGKVEMEKSGDRLQLFIKPKGCSATTVSVFIFFFFFFIPFFFSLSLAFVESEGRLYYLGVGLSAFVWILLPFGIYADVTTAWAVIVEGGQVKVREMRKSKQIKERVWSCSDMEQVEVLRRRRRRHRSSRGNKTTTEHAGLELSFPGAQNFLDSKVILFRNHAFGDNLFDWMAREIGQQAGVTVVIPSYESIADCDCCSNMDM